MEDITVVELSGTKTISVGRQVKAIDYEGCHQEIADSIRSDHAILCWVWDHDGDDKIKAWVIGYSSVKDTRFDNLHYMVEPIGEDGQMLFKNALPVKTIKRVVDEATMVKWFKDNGYPISEIGFQCNLYFVKGENHNGAHGTSIPLKVLMSCGKVIGDANPDHLLWLPDELMEEAEV